MSEQVNTYVVCDECGGAIPSGVSYVADLSVTFAMVGTPPNQAERRDFCCTAHAVKWLQSGSVVKAPAPPYPPPPTSV